MSDSLDDKLREIFKDPEWGQYRNNWQFELQRIKQAFADEGYVYMPNLKSGDYILINGGEVVLNGDGTMTPVKRMTGQEFYDRFTDLIKDHGFYENVTRDFVDESAKRAAGIDASNVIN